MIQKWEVVSFRPNKLGYWGDGDTVWLRRTKIERLGDEDFHVTDLEYKSHRLVWVDTPERGQDGYHEADEDLDAWITWSLSLGPVTAYVYDGGAGWDRKLCDLVNAAGESASQYLIIEKGWDIYGG